MPKHKGPPTELPPELSEALQRLFSGFAPAPLTAQGIAEELAELPRRPEAWLVVTEPVDLGGDKLLLSLVLAPDSPEPLLLQPLDGPESLLRFIVESIGMGQGEGDAAWEPYVPAGLAVSDAQLAFSWGNLLREAGMGVTLGVPPELQAMLRQAAQSFAQGAAEEMQPPPFLSDVSPEDARAFFRAFEGFMNAEPWEWLDDRPLFLGWQDDAGQPQHAYAVVMGHNEQEYGLSLFGQWSHYLETLLNAGEMSTMLALVQAHGGREGAVYSRGPHALADEDWAFLQTHRLTRKKRENWSGGVHRRFGVDGDLPARVPLPVLTAALDMLAERGKTVYGVKYLTSLKRTKNGVRLSYPATARDELTPEQATGWVRLRFEVADRRQPDRQPWRGLDIVAPADALASQAFSGQGFQALWLQDAEIQRQKPSKSDLTTFNYDLPDLVLRHAAAPDAGETVSLRVYERGAASLTLSQLADLAAQTPLLVRGPYNRETGQWDLQPITVERLSDPPEGADVTHKGVSLRWLR